MKIFLKNLFFEKKVFKEKKKLLFKYNSLAFLYQYYFLLYNYFENVWLLLI